MSAEIIPFELHVERISLPSMGMIARIQRLVAVSYNVPLETMRSPSHERKYAWPRQVAMYLAREVTGKSLPCIGREFHRDHSTVFTGIKAVKERMAESPLYRDDVDALREALR